MKSPAMRSVGTSCRTPRPSRSKSPPDVAQFVSEMATSNVLYIRIRSFSAGRTAAEFKVDGAPAAIASAYAGCPVKPPEQIPPMAAKPPRRDRVSSR